MGRMLLSVKMVRQISQLWRVWRLADLPCRAIFSAHPRIDHIGDLYPTDFQTVGRSYRRCHEGIELKWLFSAWWNIDELRELRYGEAPSTLDDLLRGSLSYGFFNTWILFWSFRISWVFSVDAMTSASKVALMSREEAPRRNWYFPGVTTHAEVASS